MKNKTSPTILIPNATSPRNIGDLAMLESLIGLIKSGRKNADIRIQSIDPHLYSNKDYKISDTLYGWSVLSISNPFIRTFRLLLLLLTYVAFRVKLNITPLLSAALQGIMEDYQSADKIIFAGGGYLRSKKGLKQSLNLCMQLVPFIFSKLFGAKRIVAPISFGPFAYTWQEKFAANLLKDFDVVTVREDISFKILEKYQIRNLILSTDHALLLKRNFHTKQLHTHKRFTLGFTIRNWGSSEEQQKLEDAIVNSIETVSKSMELQVQPIVQVDAPQYGDEDEKVTRRIVQDLIERGIKVLPIIINHSLSNALKTYASIDLLIGMRMHSNILSALQGVPFIGIAYEHKTRGIARQLNHEKYVIDGQHVNHKILSSLILTVKNQYKKVVAVMTQALLGIQEKEIKRWQMILAR